MKAFLVTLSFKTTEEEGIEGKEGKKTLQGKQYILSRPQLM